MYLGRQLSHDAGALVRKSRKTDLFLEDIDPVISELQLHYINGGCDPTRFCLHPSPSKSEHFPAFAQSSIMAPAGSPSIYVLPLEIIEDAIDIIAADDRQTSPFTLPNVKACSLTCHTFLPRSRRHIFRSIMIRDAHPYIQRFPPAAPSPLASSFAALLAASPHIAELVRELHYIFPEIGGRLSNASPILQKLTKLEMFGLYPDDGGTVSWWGLNPRSRSIFISLMHLPSMIHLRLGSVTDFPLSLLFSCVNLQTLCLDGVKFDEHNVHMTTQPSSSRNIKLLELELKIDHFINDAVFEIAKMITKNGDPIFDLSGLKKLTTTIHSRDQLELTYKTLRRATNIESIHLLGMSIPFDLIISRLATCFYDRIH